MNLSAKTALLVAAVMAAAISLSAPPAFAQRDSTAKALGHYDSFWSARSAARSVRHAADYSRGLQQYATRAPQVAPPIAQREVAGLRQNLESAKQDYAALRKAASEDQETLAILDAIDKHVAAADADLKVAHACCEQREIDVEQVKECCANITASLEKVQAEHEKLMKRVEAARAAIGAGKKAK